MSIKTIAIAAALLALGTSSALAAHGDLGIAPNVLNGVKHAVKKDGSLKPGAVGHRQLKAGIVSCQKLSPDLQQRLCGGIIGIPGDKGAKGDVGGNGPQGNVGKEGAPGPAGSNGPKGDRGDGLVLVDAQTPGVCYTNPTVHLTSSGVVFGPYESNEEGGSVCVDLGPGHHLADLAHLAYTASFNATTDNGDAPYLRVFTTDGTDEHDLIFSPSTQPGACYGPAPIAGAGSQCASRGRMILYTVENGTVRYDDDPGNAPDVSWASVLNTHGSDEIEAIYVTSGFALPDTTGATLNSLSYEVAGLAPSTLSFSS
jgi:hypothetical protein